jgi:hypothetical protein
VSSMAMNSRPKLPRVVVAGREYPKYDPNIALDIIERIADGELLKDITSRDADVLTVTKHTFLFWVSTVPELAKAYRSAEQLSAHSLEEEALSVARSVALIPGTPQRVSANSALLNQLRWSAGRRDPGKYAEKAAVNIAIPVTINTPLDLGTGENSKATVEIPDLYNIKLPVVDGDFTEIEPEPEPVITKKEELRHLVDTTPVTSTERQPILEAQRVKGTDHLKGPRKRVLKPRISTNGIR